MALHLTFVSACPIALSGPGIHIYMYIYTYICIYMHIYTYIYMHTWPASHWHARPMASIGSPPLNTLRSPPAKRSIHISICTHGLHHTGMQDPWRRSDHPLSTPSGLHQPSAAYIYLYAHMACITLACKTHGVDRI